MVSVGTTVLCVASMASDEEDLKDKDESFRVYMTDDEKVPIAVDPPMSVNSDRVSPQEIK